MAGPFDDLEAGQSRTIGGDNIDALVIGPFLWDSKVEIHAWHAGVKTGEGNSAYISLSQDGTEIGRRTDSKFDNYSLPIDKTAMLAKLASTTFSISYDNVMATVSSFGLQATVTRLD
ncbi:MAG: hypothetical protein A2792_08515 [Sphingomonadales bacterium RIFCSPHIGHO2_01_FULL_65_20]|uniref:hypothetical protein n=1 Tax=unclassified Blastomonas TaxID=2626550 RepID=UPI0008344A14|nr:hypothetical protein [Blastomonas sp.]MCH2239017.1 hypothetical protein [Blastomonas sp.]OHC92098.1 MAG: hypothetical protein A2792_08515 [Sphingomonadales bacterium RIFCSPHIGHO2_01_FULL_65_20]